VSVFAFRGLFLWVHLGGMVLGDDAHVAPESLIRHLGYARTVTKVVGDDSSSPWWGGGWPLFHGRGCIGVASDATDHTLISEFWGRLLG
jgi:hypothetical protein